MTETAEETDKIRMGALLQIAKEAGGTNLGDALRWLKRKKYVEVNIEMALIHDDTPILITRAGARRADGFTGRRPT